MFHFIADIGHALPRNFETNCILFIRSFHYGTSSSSKQFTSGTNINVVSDPKDRKAEMTHFADSLRKNILDMFIFHQSDVQAETWIQIGSSGGGKPGVSHMLCLWEGHQIWEVRDLLGQRFAALSTTSCWKLWISLRLGSMMWACELLEVEHRCLFFSFLLQLLFVLLLTFSMFISSRYSTLWQYAQRFANNSRNASKMALK